MDTDLLKRCYTEAKAWMLRDAHRAKARELKEQAQRAFTEHPHEAGETYLGHLRFTAGISLRFLYTALVVMIHGAFPFLLTRSASNQIEKIYSIMKDRIPKDRRDELDAGDGI